jgi:hypothetical protein
MRPPTEPVAALLGTWRGSGHGVYPTIDPFDYVEEVTFSATPKPFYVYHQRSWLADGTPAHVETGYLRLLGADRVEFVLVQPTGVVEIHEGVVGDGRIDLRSVVVATSPTAKEVRDVHRVFVVDGDTLRTRLDIAAVGQRMTLHLESALARQPAEDGQDGSAKSTSTGA